MRMNFPRTAQRRSSRQYRRRSQTRSSEAVGLKLLSRLNFSALREVFHNGGLYWLDPACPLRSAGRNADRVHGQEEPQLFIFTFREVPAGERREGRFGGRRQLYADRSHPCAGRPRIRFRQVAGHRALGTDHRVGPGHHRGLLRSGEDDLASMTEVLYGLLAPLVVVIISWVIVKRAYLANPAGLMPVLLVGMVLKLMFFAAYAAVMLRVRHLQPVPFV